LVRPEVKQFGKTKSRKMPVKFPEKKIGRPATGRDPVVNLRLSEAKQDEIRAWAEANNVKGLSEAIRQMIDYSLKAWRRSERRKAPKRRKQSRGAH
jgi:hypothetical protein